MKHLKLFLSLAVLFTILNCGKISETINQKVNEKVDETIDKKLKEYDSTLSKENLDSLKKALDSAFKDVDIDSLLKSLDSIEVKQNDKSKKKK